MDEKVYRYGYQGQFAEKDEETGWNHFELREYDPVIGRWTSTDPYGQYWSPYIGMGNDPVNGTDPDGAYSWFGAWWRNGFSFDGLIHDKEVGEWGYNTNVLDGTVNFTSHFGDEKIWRPENGQQLLDRAWENSGFAGQVSTYDRIMARGGDGIEFDALGQLSLGFLAADAIALTVRGGAAVAEGIGNLKASVYRVYGGGSSMYGKSYSLINPKYVPSYRNFAGLPNANTGQYLLRGNIPLKDIRVGRWFASPLDGKTGGLPLELYQNFNQLSKPANIILKKPF